MNQNKKYYKLATGLIFSQCIFSQLSLAAWGQTTTFVDIEAHWAQPCIETLAEQRIVGGDREQQQFRPNAPITRVEFAIILTQAFPDVKPVQEPMEFVDIPSDYWAASAIREANRRGFLSSYIAGVFNPTIEVTRLQALEALIQGLNYQFKTIFPEQLPTVFEDANEIPETAKEAIAAATENWLVVNYPNVKQLNPNQAATRAEIAAFICQALAKPQQTALIPSQYIARISITETPLAAAETVSNNLESSEPEMQETVEETESDANYPQLQPETEITQPETEATNTATNSSVIERNPTESLRDNSEKRIEIGEADTVKVELFYQTPEVLQLTIIRRGEEELSEFLALASQQDSEDFAKVVDVNILDLDKDNEPEIMIDFVGRDPSNRPLYYSLIYRYSSFIKQYKSFKHTWGFLPYQKQTSAVNNTPIFISFDHRFSENYNSEIPEHLPLQIWQYQSGEMQDETSVHPELVQKQTAILWLELNQYSQSEQDLQGIIAAYLANKSVLGEAEEGWQRVEQLYQDNDAADFFNQLRQFLQETGYLE